MVAKVIDLNEYRIEREKLRDMNYKKFKTFEKYINSGLVYIDFDPTIKSVRVPPLYKTGGRFMCLSFSYKFQDVTDLKFNSSHVSATLAFDTKKFLCVIPWEAIYSIRTKNPKEAVLFSGDDQK